MNGVGALRFHLDRELGDGEIPGWLLDPVLISLLIGAAALYLDASGRLRRRNDWGARVVGWRVACFMGAQVILFVTLLSPLDGIGELHLFWVHMIQHMILVLVVSPLILLGVPGWMIDRLVQQRMVRVVAYRLTRPIAALLISQFILIAWHVPATFEAALGDRHVHHLEHLSFMIAGVLMWWPMLSRSRALPGSEPVWLIPYLFVLPIPTSILGAMITFAREVIYESYALAPRLWNLSALRDQEISGLIMWVPGKLIFWLVMGVIFYRWFDSETKSDRPERQMPSAG